MMGTFLAYVVICVQFADSGSGSGAGCDFSCRDINDMAFHVTRNMSDSNITHIGGS